MCEIENRNNQHIGSNIFFHLLANITYALRSIQYCKFSDLCLYIYMGNG